MDRWIEIDIQTRREQLYAQAARARTIRSIESGRSRRSVRRRIANGAQSLSDLLAGFARSMREHEA